MVKLIPPVIILLLAALANAQPTQPTTQAATTQPVFLFHPPDGTIIENVVINAKDFPPAQRGIGIGVNGSLNCTIRNCVVIGFRFCIEGQGGNPGIKIYNNVVTDATSGGTDDAQGIYVEGAANGWAIHDNVGLNCGWWPGYNPNDPVQKAAAARHHTVYLNESGGATGDGSCYNNIFLDCTGSNITARKGGKFYGNVFRPGLDQDLIVGQLAESATVTGNAFFGPRLDAPPYWGGGIKLQCPAINCAGNVFAGSAGITFNPTAVDGAGNAIAGQVGLWTKPGASRVVAAGTPVPSLESIYGVSSQKELYAAIRPGDAPWIIQIMQAWTKTLPNPPVIVVPAPVPAPFDITLTVDPRTGKVVQK